MASSAWQGLLENLAILAVLVSIWTYLREWVEDKPNWQRTVFCSVLAGGGVILLMLLPIEIRPGILIDLRWSLIALAGFLGSPPVGLVAGLVAAAFRIHLGGVGATAGVISIAIATVVGIAGNRLLHGRRPSVGDLLIFSMVNATVPMLGAVVLPHNALMVLITSSALPMASISFTATMLAGVAILQSDRRREFARANLFYHSIIDALPEPLNAKDLQGRFIAANPATARQVNAPDVVSLIGKTDFDFHPRDSALRFRADEERVLANDNPETIEQQLMRQDGSSLYLSTLKAPLHDRAGNVAGLLTHNRDITERKRLEREIAESRQHLRDAMEHMADGLAMFDKNARLVLCNEQYRTMFPLTTEMRVPGARLADILRASVERGERIDVAPEAIEPWLKHTLATFTEPGETDIQLFDGRWIRARVRPTDDGGSLTLMTDVTRIRQAEAVLTEANRHLLYLASRDALTGLANRGAYDGELQRALAESRRASSPLSLLLIDVDHFKAYNDAYGHPAGDTCLCTIANLIRISARRPSDVAARYGGEEFAVILPDTPAEGAFEVAENLRKSVISLGVEHRGSKHGVLTISIGVATIMGGSGLDQGKELTASADAALYAAKAGGRNRTAFGKLDSRLAVNE